MAIPQSRSSAHSIDHEQAYRASVVNPLDEIARKVQNVLTRRLTAYIAGVKSGKTVTRWATGDVSKIRHESNVRLRTAYEIVQLFEQMGESKETTLAWFLGLNPILDDVPPAEAIHEGQLQDSLNAARAFVSGSY